MIENIIKCFSLQKWYEIKKKMIWHGNVLRIIPPLWGIPTVTTEFISQRFITVLLELFLCYYREQAVERAVALQWRHNGRDSVLNHQPCECLLSRLIRRRSKKTSKLRVTGFCAGNSPETGEFAAQRARNAENVSIWWRHRGVMDNLKRHDANITPLWSCIIWQYLRKIQEPDFTIGLHIWRMYANPHLLKEFWEYLLMDEDDEKVTYEMPLMYLHSPSVGKSYVDHTSSIICFLKLQLANLWWLKWSHSYFLITHRSSVQWHSLKSFDWHPQERGLDQL